MDQLTRWQQPANWVQHLTNSNWQSDIMILTPVRDHSQLMVVSSPAADARVQRRPAPKSALWDVYRVL
eukprot:897876-Prymnesium_polylepis.1